MYQSLPARADLMRQRKDRDSEGTNATKFAALMDAIKKRDEEIKEMCGKALEEIASGKADMAKFALRLVEIEQKHAVRSGLPIAPYSSAAAAPSLGSILTTNAAFLEGMKKGRLERTEIEIPNLKTVVTTQADGATGYPVQPQQIGPVTGVPIDPVMWTALTSMNVTSNAIEIVRGTLDDQSAPVAETAQKPQSDMAFTPDDLNVRTIATWVRASNQVLSDVPSMAAFIDAQLRMAINKRLDLQLLYGNGVSPNIEGFTTQGTAYVPGATDGLIDTLVRVAATLLARGASGSVIGINAMTLADLILQKDSNGDYVVNPFTLITQVLGARLVPSAAIAAGDFVAIGGALGGTVGMRQAITVEMSTEDADNFQKNLVTVRAECRAVAITQTPQLCLYGPLLAAPAP
ncbi:phage major capsid protein [Cupriavidus pinatubonensis]|uniref:phage major capsid protein n=1 Tax=Cupriavidus pinatubonensis TaxID=248026 RepID=UPI0011270FB0|nr:phage major capsid protein [Cupriavidus pinatubonensis]TPQ35711.1 phage major capsid protein [Cupriavidus pinatubonensis]